MTTTPKDVLSLAKDEDVQIVDLRFCDLPGLMQHFSVPISELTEEGFEVGFGFDGSSIRGFQEIQESDMLLVPDPEGAYIDPFLKVPTLVLHCFVKDPVTGEMYSRDPRWIARKAELHLQQTGIAETSYWGPECEFYIFDSIRFDQNQHEGYYHIGAVEGAWNTGAEEGGKNLGYKPRYKEGYFPLPPMDHYQDLRTDPPSSASPRPPRTPTAGWSRATRRLSTSCTRSATEARASGSPCTTRAPRRSAWSSARRTRRAIRTSRSRRCSWRGSTA